MLRIHTRFLGILASCTIALSALTIPPAHAEDRFILDIVTPRPFPNITFTDLDDNAQTLEETKGKLTIVHFWATWCVPCVDELPELNEIQQKYEVVGLKVISISLDGEKNKGKVESFLKTNNINSLKPYMDNSSKAFELSHAKGMPTSFFINEKSETIAVSEGKLDWLSPKTAGFIEFNLYKAKK